MPILDERQILQKVLNSTEDRLKVEINATITAGAVEVAIDQATDSIKIGDGTDLMDVNPDGSINVVIVGGGGGGGGSAVADKTGFVYGTTVQTVIGGVYQDTSPTLTAGVQGAARVTEYRGLHINLRDASGVEIGTNTTPVRIDPTGTTTQPISAIELPLPTGASTEDAQITGNTLLESLDDKIIFCDTNDVTISSTVLPPDAATETTLDAINNKISVCDTTAVQVTSSVLPDDAATESTLNDLNNKITACDTSNVIVTESALPTGAATEDTLALIQTSADNILSLRFIKTTYFDFDSLLKSDHEK